MAARSAGEMTGTRAVWANPSPPTKESNAKTALVRTMAFSPAPLTMMNMREDTPPDNLRCNGKITHFDRRCDRYSAHQIQGWKNRLQSCRAVWILLCLSTAVPANAQQKEQTNT